MIEGHVYLSAVIPPGEKMVFAIILAGVGLVICYVMVKGLFRYIAWRERPAEVKHGRN